MRGHIRIAIALAAMPGLLVAQRVEGLSNVLPDAAVVSLTTSLDAAASHSPHVWRDTPPLDADGAVNAYVEIARGDRRKWEFDMGANALALDRVIPPDVGGYPVNYGFVPQTISYDGDPFDVLVLGPPLPGGQFVRGQVVGLMLMEDEKGADSKVVLSPTGRDGRATHGLDDGQRQRIGDYFERYKRHEPGKFARVPGWGSAADGRAHIRTTHAFFRECRKPARASCRLSASAITP
jgi:inorganic pyrophosphatase